MLDTAATINRLARNLVNHATEASDEKALELATALLQLSNQLNEDLYAFQQVLDRVAEHMRSKVTGEDYTDDE